MNIFTKWKWWLPGLLLVQLGSCTKHDGKPDQEGVPTVTFSTGEYKVKVGKSIMLSPQVKNADLPVYSWKMDGKIISRDVSYSFDGAQVGEYFVTLRVDAENGSAEQQIKVTVMDKLPPQINMPTNIVAYQGKDNQIAAVVAYTDSVTKYTWRLNGTVVSGDSIYTLKPTVPGSSTLTLQVTNADGLDLKTMGLVVLAPQPPGLFFDDGHYRLPGDVLTRRLSVPLGKSLVLAPVIMNIPSVGTFAWTVDGAAQGSTSQYLTFTPQAKKTYHITVATSGVSAAVDVECVDAEGAFFRAPSAGSKPSVTNSFEYVPAPGQFTDYGTFSTAGQATQDIQNILDQGPGNTGFIAGLGAYGGYVITGFDHSVSNVVGKADLIISGNEFTGWSEPGIVWVMQDENGNGLPDDTWYELKGSESGKPETRQRYAITYYKPTTLGADVLWVDNFGGTGSVDYNQYHLQPYYFPMFINADSYTLTGTDLKSTFKIDPATSYEVSPGYAWGYVDNLGDGSKVNFWLEDAIQADGTPANLKYIDFVKVQTGMTGKGVAVGEISTEFGAPYDLNLNH